MKQKLPPFVPLFINTLDSPAWLEMSLGARVLYLAFKKRYHRKTQQAVFLSARVAAKELGVNKDTVSRWYRELQHFGFIMQVRGASFGPGRGRAAEFRLADERYKGKPPSMEFTYWNGTPFGPEAANVPSEKPGRKTGFPSEKPGHSRPKNPDRNPRFAHFSRPKNPDTSRKDSSHLLRGQSHRHREWQGERAEPTRGARDAARPRRAAKATARQRALSPIAQNRLTYCSAKCRNTAVEDSVRPLTSPTPLTAGHDLICAQCGAGLATDPPSDAPTIRVTNGKAKEVWVHAGRCRQFWIEEHPQFQFKQEQDRA